MSTRTIAMDGYTAWLDEGAVATRESLNKIAALMRRDNKGGMSARQDGTGRFRSSLIGGCERKQALSYLGAEQNGFDRTAVTLGTWAHYRWQIAGLSQGFLDKIEVKVKRRINGVWFGGQVDGILSDGSMLELKTTNGFSFESVKNTPMFQHVAQVNLYLHLLGLGVASLVYEDRNFGHLAEHEVVYSKTLYETTITRASINKDIADKGMLPVMHPDCKPNTWMRTGCQFRDVCLRRWVTDEVVPD